MHLIFHEIQIGVVGHKPFAVLEGFNHRMPSVADLDLAVAHHVRTAVAVLHRGLGQPRQHIQIRKCGSTFLNAHRMGEHLLPQLGKELLLKNHRPVLRAENLVFHFLKCRGDEAFRIHQGLFALIVLRHQIQVRFAHFDVIAEYLVVADLQVLNPGLFLLLDLEFRQPVPTFRGCGPEFIQLGMNPLADHPAILEIYRWLLHQPAINMLRQFRQGMHLVPKTLQEHRATSGQNRFQIGQSTQRLGQRLNLAGIPRLTVQPGQQPLHVFDFRQFFPDGTEIRLSIPQCLNGIVAFGDGRHVAQGTQNPLTQPTRTHRGLGGIEDL